MFLRVRCLGESVLEYAEVRKMALLTTVNFLVHSPQVMNCPTAFNGPGLTFSLCTGFGDARVFSGDVASSRSSELTEVLRVPLNRRLEAGPSNASDTSLRGQPLPEIGCCTCREDA